MQDLYQQVSRTPPRGSPRVGETVRYWRPLWLGTGNEQVDAPAHHSAPAPESARNGTVRSDHGGTRSMAAVEKRPTRRFRTRNPALRPAITFCQ